MNKIVSKTLIIGVYIKIGLYVGSPLETAIEGSK